MPTADLQLRSYHVRTREFFCDFALRAAYYLDLAAFGPVPLPKITERWTVPRSNFIFKKSQENFERITRRRLIQIRDGHPEAVQAWLAFLRKHAIAGVGMKANVWEFGSLGRFAPAPRPGEGGWRDQRGLTTANPRDRRRREADGPDGQGRHGHYRSQVAAPGGEQDDGDGGEGGGVAAERAV